jgi:hypothetical protein
VKSYYGGAVWAMVLFSKTGFYELINSELSKGQIFRIQSTFGNPPKFLILVTNLQICVKVAICPKSPSLTVNKINKIKFKKLILISIPT